MQFKQKLIYFALGCAFVVIGQVLLNVVVPKVTAQGEKESVDLIERIRAQGKKETVEFDTVKVRSLQVVDDEGKVRARLEVTKRPSVASVDDVIQVFDRAGVSVYRVGVTTNGGDMNVYDKGGGVAAGMGVGANGGMVTVADNNGKTCAAMQVLPEGGVVVVLGNDGKLRAVMSVNEYGNGVVNTWDKNGYRIR